MRFSVKTVNGVAHVDPATGMAVVEDATFVDVDTSVALGASGCAVLADTLRARYRGPWILRIGGGATAEASATDAAALLQLARAIAEAPRLTVAILHGDAGDDALALALACRRRLALEAARIGFRLPEQGMLPRAGAPSRLARLAGADTALSILLSMRLHAAPELHNLGVIDGVVDATLPDAATLAAAAVAPVAAAASVQSAASADAIVERARKRIPRTTQVLETLVRGIASRTPDRDDAANTEAARSLDGTGEHAALRYIADAERDAAHWPEEDAGVASVGVIGAGTMGAGIAVSFLNAGLPVVLVETSDEALSRGVSRISQTYAGSVRSGRLDAAKAEQRMARLKPTLRFEDLVGCDFIAEAVYEDMDVKRDIFSRLDRIAGPQAVLASNTSYLDLDRIAEATARPGSVVGMHFFSPAHVMKLVEIVRGRHTGERSLRIAEALAQRLGKVSVIVGVCHGFVGNRMLARRREQADRLVLEGATPWDVDRVIEDFGLPMGPFRVSDLAGIDLGWKRETSTSSTIREVLNEAGRHGRKSGAGFYDYDAAGAAAPSPFVEAKIRELAGRQGIVERTVSDQEILERCLYVTINEGAKILEEGIARDERDIDVVWVNGYGWPRHLGGPMYHARHRLGHRHVAQRLQFYADLGLPQLAPARLLQVGVAKS
ncbi:3-hydroxyacyl-CoA dehydrogenase NAD-binding domain-containing protein [Sinimarinibacterium flocculans]|uniref:3-hydroxyacyl-CoA dehydrogenase NAD-binding domain-containing protein n=1 Tax=Sinimarinibacterium flocculans TaxID=985250 RepID=UPI0024916E03|nr:3-hydroxyacyl-CoA dehydrogenase NAD-binding domain-containing protein [Sinimarinibacterium flocculans]